MKTNKAREIYEQSLRTHRARACSEAPDEHPAIAQDYAWSARRLTAELNAMVLESPDSAAQVAQDFEEGECRALASPLRQMLARHASTRMLAEMEGA